MTLESYLLSWAIYLSCASVLLAIFWYLTAKLNIRILRTGLRASVSVLLLMPYSIGDDYSELAPAIIMFAMETLFEAAPQRVGIPYLIAWVAVLCISVGWGAWRNAALKRQKAEQRLNADRDELLDQSRRVEPSL